MRRIGKPARCRGGAGPSWWSLVGPPYADLAITPDEGRLAVDPHHVRVDVSQTPEDHPSYATTVCFGPRDRGASRAAEAARRPPHPFQRCHSPSRPTFQPPPGPSPLHIPSLSTEPPRPPPTRRVPRPPHWRPQPRQPRPGPSRHRQRSRQRHPARSRPTPTHRNRPNLRPNPRPDARPRPPRQSRQRRHRRAHPRAPHRPQTRLPTPEPTQEARQTNLRSAGPASGMS
jgi:hypothetical protein